MDQLPNKEFIQEVIIPLYIRQYTKSKSVRAKYYEKGSKRKVPEKYKDTTKFEYRPYKATVDGKKGLRYFLTEISTGIKVIANAHLVGTENIKNINGQGIYNGNISSHDRNNMMSHIKRQFSTYIKRMKPITDFPIRIDVYLFDTVLDELANGQDWDVDNRFFPYGKTFSDMLKIEGIIPEDNRYYITEPPHAIFVPVDDPEDRKLVVRIYKDTRPVISNNYLYQKYHGK